MLSHLRFWIATDFAYAPLLCFPLYQALVASKGQSDARVALACIEHCKSHEHRTGAFGCMTLRAVDMPQCGRGVYGNVLNYSAVPMAWGLRGARVCLVMGEQLQKKSSHLLFHVPSTQQSLLNTRRVKRGVFC